MRSAAGAVVGQHSFHDDPDVGAPVADNWLVASKDWFFSVLAPAALGRDGCDLLEIRMDELAWPVGLIAEHWLGADCSVAACTPLADWESTWKRSAVASMVQPRSRTRSTMLRRLRGSAARSGAEH